MIENVFGYARENGFSVAGLTYSPIKGPEGNIEYLVLLSLNFNNTAKLRIKFKPGKLK